MKKILMLVGKNNYNLFFKPTTEYEGTYCDIYKNIRLVRFFRNTNLFVGLTLLEWKNHLLEYDAIICIDSIITPNTINWICKHREERRLILYFRNKINTNRWNISKLKKMPLEVWSYNIHDCESYGIKYNCEVSNKEKYREYDTSIINYSLTFVGANKGREALISRIHEVICSSVNSDLPAPYFYMVDAENKSWNQCKDNSNLSYSEYMSKLSQSIAVLDLVSQENYGLTVRAVEAMFLRKKIVTNYTDIERYDFYNPNNVFILGKDDLEKLKTFLEMPYNDVNDEIVNSYSTDEWIKRFF